jgi:D-alanyl-D-alanine carboxypeptidase (penicillin-binding protein 5/6)
MAECGLVLPTGMRTPPDVTAAAWVLQDLDTGAVLAAKDPHGRHRPASLIKTLLAVVVLSRFEPGDVITATEEDASQECTCVGIVDGGRYTVDQLLHGLLMHSGNDAAHTLATALGGVDTAVRKMNLTAADLGAADTRVATPSGLDGPGMSTSAYDLSLIFNHAMRLPEFAAVVATRQFEFPGAPGKPPITVVNDNKLLGSYPGFLGGKTGFTDDARHTYVGAAHRGGKRLAVVIVRAEQRPTRVTDQASQLLDFGFSLATSDPSPVGQIALKAPSTPGSGDEAGAAPGEHNLAAGGSVGAKDPFGVTGWILTLIVACLIIAGFVVGRRRKQRATPQDPDLLDR